MRRSRTGFTLIELLVVIAVIAILASLLLPVLSRTVERGRMAKCASNVRQMAMALSMYAGDYGFYPPLQYPSSQPGAWPNSWYVALTPYLSSWKATSSPYQCPSFKYDFLTNGEPVFVHVGPYGYNGDGPYALSPGALTPEYFAAFGSSKQFFVSDTKVVAPSRMIAIGDSLLLWGSPTRLITGSTALSYMSITDRRKWPGFKYEMKAIAARHFGRFQIGFCDGHTQSSKYEDLFADNEEARRCWHVDNQPH